MWQIELRHDGLNKYRVIRGNDQSIVHRKAQAQQAIWDEMWQKRVERDTRQQERELKRQELEDSLEEARGRTEAAQDELAELSSILAHTLGIDDKVDWDALKKPEDFPEPPPEKPRPEPLPIKPQLSSLQYQPTLGFLDKLISSRRERICRDCEEAYARDVESWKGRLAEVESENAARDSKFSDELAAWNESRSSYAEDARVANAAVDARRALYDARDPNAILDYCELVLSNSKYPEYFPQSFDCDYTPETRMLVVDYELPAVDSLPSIKEVKYVKTRDEFDEISIGDAALRKLYDEVLYQICLRSIHELFESDTADALDSVVFNGWISSTDRATGKPIHPCVLSVQTTKSNFKDINLSAVDCRACFKSLKGVASTKLSSMAAVPPIMTISREDDRFIQSYGVVQELDDRTNLAAMDWEDFEHLIRELFEKEFAKSGGEVKVTQASRDGGVDAIAFDPDPIRGGKIVIQAKRYTRTVGVSAVRDLYGTVLNEGATKGVLVTTADYGPDAYEFSSGKPLTLLNGSNLLHLLEKHGHRAKIDLKEAREMLQ